MDNQDNQNKINSQNEENQTEPSQNEEKMNVETNQIEENSQNENNINDNNQQKNEEEKNNEESNNEEEQENLLRQKQQEEAERRKAQRQAHLQMVGKKYDNLLESIKNQWEADKSNFGQFFDNQISKPINTIVNFPCIVLQREIISFVFKFLCRYFCFLKDNLKDIPINVMHQAAYIFQNNVFSRNPKININNQLDQDNYDLIGDNVFYYLFKEMSPNAEIINHEFNPSYNCMLKYFNEYLFQIEYNKKYITDFLSREDLDFDNYIYFCDYSFQALIYCDDNFIKQNDYNLLIIRNFTQKMKLYLEHSQEYIKENKNGYLQSIKSIVDTYYTKVFGGLTRVLDIFLKNNLEKEIEDFYYYLNKPFEILLKQQKLELRIVGISHLSYIVNIFKGKSDFLKSYYNDYESVFEYTKKILVKFLLKINIFDLIFGENIHEAVIGRSYDIFSFLYKNDNFPPEQIALLWKISQTKYQSIGNSIIGLFGKLLPEFSNNDCKNILQTVSNMNFSEVNEITLKLLENFFISEQRHENLLNILYRYSNELSFYEDLSRTIITNSRNILIKLLFNKKYVNDLEQCIKNCLFCLDNNYLLNTNRTIFIEIMKEFIQTEKTENTVEIFKLFNENISNFGNLIYYLDGKYSMINVLMTHLLFMKKLFIFFTEEAIRLKNLINEGNFDFDSLLNINALMLKYKEYEQKNNNNEEEKKMDIESDNIIINNNNIIDNDIHNNSYLLPKNKNDIEKYLSLIMNDFILYFKNKLLKEKISLEEEEIKNNIFTQFEFSFEKNTYQKIITNLIDFISNFHTVGNIYYKRNIFDFLYKLLVENSVFKGENEIFFNFIDNIISLQLNNNFTYNLLTEQDIEYLCLEKICSNQIVKLPHSAYEAIKRYIIYINEKNGNINYSKDTSKFIDIKKIHLFVGFKTLLEFYVLSKERKTFLNCFATISNIIEICASDMIKRKYILDELFKLLENYKIKMKEKTTIETNDIEKVAFRRILKIISIINKTKVTKNLYDANDDKNFININIINHFYFKNNNEINSYRVFIGLTIDDLKNQLIDKIICNDQNSISLFNNLCNYPHQEITSLEELKNEFISNNLIILYYNSNILKNDFTLADYNINSNDTIFILNRTTEDLNGQDFQMNDEQLKDAYEQIKVVFNDRFNEEIMKEALYKEKGDIQNAIIFLTNQENADNLIKEVEMKKKNEPKKKEELICLEENKFNILLDILNEGDSDLNSSVWDLFAEIKFQEQFIIDSITNGFDNILEEKNINKKILILKIINSVIFGDEKFCKNNKVTKSTKSQWIYKFINNEKFIRQILILLSELKIEENEQINYSKIIYIIINWFLKIFTKISDLIKNKNYMNINNDNNTISDSGSNFNIIIDKEECKNNENNDNNDNKDNNNNKEDDIYGEFIIIENDANNFIQILTSNNFICLIYKILGIVLDFTKLQVQDEKKKIIQSIYEILVEYLQIKQIDIIQFLEEEKKTKKLENILMSCKETEIRKSTLNFIKNLMDNIKLKNESEPNDTNKTENKFDIQSNLLQIYTPDLISDEVYCDEFYELYNYLINFEIVKTSVIPVDKIIEKFLNDLYNFYMKCQNINVINEENNDKNNNKEQLEKVKSKMEYNLYVLCSFNSFYSELLDKEIERKLNENKDIISILYTSLFNLEKYQINNNNLNYLFTGERLRANAFNFLSIIISIDKKYFDMISKKIIVQHTKILPKKNGLPLFFPLRDFSKEKFIGLRNFGATCYLNSLFQQMFMIPTFYQDLFKFNVVKENENDDLIYSTIYNMQLSFINLKKSCMSFYPPIDFIKSFKTAFNGEPINLGIQQDTDEFLAILCDELEKEAKKYGKENFLENSFKGKITNEIVSLEKEYPYYSQTVEPFYRITLDIKGHNNLEDALDAYIKGEVLEGDNQYYVEKYKKKISILKRTSIKKIGNQIIIHLKRFEFDFYTFQNNKLNDYLKFPLKINFKKWTRAYLRMNEVNSDENKENKENSENDVISEEEKENLIDEKMNYELTGILIHSGASLQSGHYYSFIKDQETNKWYKFNDSTISEYDIDNDLEKECFGNIDSKINQYGKGAYLLFYTKKECIDSYKNYEENIKINENILKKVESENIEFIKLKSYEEDSYKNFLIQFIKCSLNYLKDKDISTQRDNDYSILMNKDILREIQIYEKLINLLKGNKENNIDINDEEIKTLPENIEQIYEKCKTEIIYLEKDGKKNNIILKDENITTKNIIKLLFCFSFGIIYPYNNLENKLDEFLNLFFEMIQKNNKYSVYILKLMEKHIDIFIDLLFKFGYKDKDMTGINKTIDNLYKILFNSIYCFEKEKYGLISNEQFYIFVKDNKGKLIIEKQYKSLFLRMFEKIICKNFEKCRIEYLKENVFLDILNYVIFTYPEASLVSSKYFYTMASLITNNSVDRFKSQINPNFKMGTNQNYAPNSLHLTAFCNTILRCVTPGMLLSNKRSPYFIARTDFNEENPDFSSYPKIPENIYEYLENFLLNYILFSPSSYSNILQHISFCDKTLSYSIMKFYNKNLKLFYFYYYSNVDIALLRLCEAFNLNDGLNEIRNQTLFELDKTESNEEPLFDFYIRLREQFPLILIGIYIFAKVISIHQDVYEYFVKNKNKVAWVKDYYAVALVNFGDKTNDFNKKYGNTFDKYPDLLHTIENDFINKLEI